LYSKPGRQVAVLITEVQPRRWRYRILQNQRGLLLATVLRAAPAPSSAPSVGAENGSVALSVVASCAAVSRSVMAYVTDLASIVLSGAGIVTSGRR
jgi:hypothetical protein